MERETPQAKGWRSFRFDYGASLTVEVTTPTESQLTEQLLNHIDALVYGGWRCVHPHLDELDQQ